MQRCGEPVADRIQFGRGHIPVPQDEAVVLISLEQLLAAALTAHDEQAAVGQQIGRSDQLPGALEQAGIELLHQFGDEVDP